MTGPVLWSPSYPKPNFHVPRFYCAYLAVNWANQIVLDCSEELVLQETIFGGYTAHIKLHHWYWPYTSKTLKIQDAFETLYVLPPGGGSPISAGVCSLDWHFDVNAGDVPVLALIMQGATVNHWTYHPLPPATSPWQAPWPSSWPACYTVTYP